MPRPKQYPFARQPAGHAPRRRPGSIRRTTSIDSNWPNGFDEPWEMSGRARDLLTREDGSVAELATGSFQILTSPRREVLAIETDPSHPGAAALIGLRAGGASRATIAAQLGDLHGSPLYQLLDDFAGASLVAGWIRTRWPEHPSTAKHVAAPPAHLMIDICAGFAAGASSFKPDGTIDTAGQSSAEVGPLEDPADALGWHPMPSQAGAQMRRARRIDIWREGGRLKVDTGFQDSGSEPSGGRSAVHEYRVLAELDPETGELVAIDTFPLVLPYRECPGAALETPRMLGRKVADFRTEIVSTLPSTLGCTHLNDVLRALADVPALAMNLPAPLIT